MVSSELVEVKWVRLRVVVRWTRLWIEVGLRLRLSFGLKSYMSWVGQI